MANRVLRDWTDSDRMNSLSAEAERFFTRLIMKVDDYGRYSANVKLLRSALFPLLVDDIREQHLIEWLDECQKNGVLNCYCVEGKQYLEICDFGQRLRAMVSKYPASDGKLQTNVSVMPLETNRNELEEEKNVVPTFTHLIQKYVYSKLENVRKLKKQLTHEECEKLVELFPKELIDRKLQAMDNTAKLSTKYVSVFKTLKNWCEMELDRKKSENKPPIIQSQTSTPIVMK